MRNFRNFTQKFNSIQLLEFYPVIQNSGKIETIELHCQQKFLKRYRFHLEDSLMVLENLDFP